MSDSKKSGSVRLGEIAVEMKLISRDDLDAFLEAKKHGTSFVGIGERLVFKGLITRPQLELLLTEQARRLGAEGDRLFGQIAIDEGVVSSSAVKSALEEQRERSAKGLKTPIGMILVERGILTISDVERVIASQIDRSRGGRGVGPPKG